jgi:hypothetical protein
VNIKFYLYAHVGSNLIANIEFTIVTKSRFFPKSLKAIKKNVNQIGIFLFILEIYWESF